MTESRKSSSEEISTLRRSSGDKLGSTLVIPESANKLHKILTGGNEHELGLIETEEGVPAKDMKESLRSVIRAHFPGAEEGTLPEFKDAEISEGCVEWISVERVEKAIKQFKPKKAAGPDGIKPLVLQNLPVVALMELTKIYEACIQSGDLPERWKEAKMVLIPKIGKSSYTKANAFRPITLSNHCLKVLERLALWHVEDTALKENPISEDQHAYRPDASTETAILTTINRIEEGLKKNPYVVMVAADVSNAFNGVAIDPLCHELLRRGVDRQLVAGIRL